MIDCGSKAVKASARRQHIGTGVVLVPTVGALVVGDHLLPVPGNPRRWAGDVRAPGRARGRTRAARRGDTRPPALSAPASPRFIVGRPASCGRLQSVPMYDHDPMFGLKAMRISASGPASKVNLRLAYCPHSLAMSPPSAGRWGRPPRSGYAASCRWASVAAPPCRNQLWVGGDVRIQFHRIVVAVEFDGVLEGKFLEAGLRAAQWCRVL